jgi:hypothetical protein
VAERREIPERVAGGRVKHPVEVLLQTVHAVQRRRDAPLHLDPLELRHLPRRGRAWDEAIDGGREAVQRRELAECRVQHPRIEVLGGQGGQVRPVHLADVRRAIGALHGVVAAAQIAAA